MRHFPQAILQTRRSLSFIKQHPVFEHVLSDMRVTRPLSDYVYRDSESASQIVGESTCAEKRELRSCFQAEVHVAVVVLVAACA